MRLFANRRERKARVQVTYMLAKRRLAWEPTEVKMAMVRRRSVTMNAIGRDSRYVTTTLARSGFVVIYDKVRSREIRCVKLR